MNAAQDKGQVQMDATQVYREDTFTDRRVGTIRRMTPVSANGEPDPAPPAQQ